MNKERLLAARKKLKEFQQHKHEMLGDTQNHNDLEKHNNDYISRKHTPINSSPTPQQSLAQHFEPDLEVKENHSNEIIGMKNVNQYPHCISYESQKNYFTLTKEQEKKTNQDSFIAHESTHKDASVSSYNNFVPHHSRNGSSSTTSSQIIHENNDQDIVSQHSSTQPMEHFNFNSNTCTNASSSLQKEHLLQMANAVANVLEHEQNLDESTLNNSDLEQRNQFLTCCLEEQKKLVSQLHIQVSQSNNKIAELEAKLSTKSADYESRLIQELNPLREQIQLDAQTIGILVGEKAELTAANTQLQTTIRQKTEDITELFGNFKSSQHKMVDLERELTTIKNNMEDLSNAYQELRKKYDEALETSANAKKQNEEHELEISEMRQKLNYKNTELTNLQQEFQEKVALLSLSELRIQQLSNGPQEINALENQHHATKVLQQQLSRMKEAFESVSGEKDEVNKKYQSYLQQLDERHSKLLTDLESAKRKIEESEIREQSYIQRLSELEQQLQREKSKTVPPVEDQSEKIAILTKSMDNLVLEHENLQSMLNEKENEIENLKKDLKELQDIKEQSAEASKLAQALQSEQLGASRAVSQNHQLKIQLDEMHDAFIALSNTKLDLTEQLQAERTIGKKLNAQLNEVENQMEQLKEELSQKEAALLELEKERLLAAQIEDQIQHYQAQSHNAVPLQQELQKALVTIETLKKENQLLISKSQAIETTTVTAEIHQENRETMPDITVTTGTNVDEIADSTTISSFFTNVNVSSDSLEAGARNPSEKLEDDAVDTSISKTQFVIPEASVIPSVSEPMKKLEIRFKETMEKVAELTDEKQRLEHLVLQLQGETETIGEYVTLYQKQRAILQEKAKEKENTFRQLLEQRNQQQEQLHKLKVLVADLLKAKNTIPNITTATAAEENMHTSENPDSETNNIEIIQGHVNKIDEAMNQTDKTTSQILDLLTEIKDCNNSCIMKPNFHPCPCCSGKLITV
ncbi:golgin subfamily A member 2 isoform X2 [Phymastichus coffea]|uniref:golgin subfamily A member 2 isoform X2 n=1 Tax=Phymastichus coffea TaxID=108790 RepID=UPI00273AE3B8|nr:golgin subfamily A member 2 isoform X2 [Phymastichus coffea]